MYWLILVLIIFASVDLSALDVRAYRQEREIEILNEFAKLLSIPNVASDKENIWKNAEFISTAMERRGIKVKLLESKDAPPGIYGEYSTPGAKRTLLFYAHYDGQPVNPKSWTVTSPWKPIVKSPDGTKVTLPYASGQTTQVNP